MDLQSKFSIQFKYILIDSKIEISRLNDFCGNLELVVAAALCLNISVTEIMQIIVQNNLNIKTS